MMTFGDNFVRVLYDYKIAYVDYNGRPPSISISMTDKTCTIGGYYDGEYDESTVDLDDLVQMTQSLRESLVFLKKNVESKRLGWLLLRRMAPVNIHEVIAHEFQTSTGGQ